MTVGSRILLRIICNSSLSSSSATTLKTYSACISYHEIVELDEDSISQLSIWPDEYVHRTKVSMGEDLGILGWEELTQLSLCTRDDGSEPRRQHGLKKRELVKYGGSDGPSLILHNWLQMEPTCGQKPSSHKRVS